MKEKNSYFKGEKYLLSFLIGFGIMLCCVLPFMVMENGHFIYYGDFNAQQMPFYSLANDAIRNGQFGWNWYTDLGSDLLTSYSFYLIGSPFFWLTVLLPRAAVVYAMPVVLAVKHGIASMTAYAYIRRFVRSKDMSVIGGLLYAFSGFQVFNIFFNHFQDVTALFPLMLIAMEERINNNRKGWFAVIVAIMAINNYYFFCGQAVFLVIYYIIRSFSSDFRTSFGKFFGLAFEAVLGTMIAGFILIPSAILITGNYRVSEHLLGKDLVIYSDKTTILRVIQSFFMPVDVPARPNLFKSDYCKWASIGGYFPLFSMLGVITAIRTHRQHWAVRLSWTCMIFASVPFLNSLFQAANGYYYARWFYMPILIFAMLTARILDEKGVDFSFAFGSSAVFLAALALYAIAPSKDESGEAVWFKIPADIEYFFITWGIAAASLVAAFVIIKMQRKKGGMEVVMIVGTVICCVICNLTAMIYGAVSPENAEKYIKSAIDGKDAVYEHTDSSNFFRMDISEDCDNYSMFWGMPNMRAFQSVVTPSIMEFYSSLGIKRDVASRADVSHYTLRGLLSVKYFYREKKKEMAYPSGESTDLMSDISDRIKSSVTSKEIKAKDVCIPEELKGFEYVGENEYFEIYENKLFIPMGIGYDKYISEENAKNKAKATREKMLINVLVLSDEQIEKYGDILEMASVQDTDNLDKFDYERSCIEKQKNCGDSFSYDSKGFRSEITLEKPELVFYSVPYSEGWTAEVNGVKADVEKVSGGFMAVKADAGKNEIVFRYETPYLKIGAIVSGSGILILAIYMLIGGKSRKKPENRSFPRTYDYC